MARVFSNTKNVETILMLLLSALKIKVPGDALRKCMRSHPDYPSMLAISDCLSEWRIPNDTYQISREQYHPEAFDYPFVAYIPKRGFMLVTSISNGIVRYSDESGKDRTIGENVFLDIWNGIFLHATPDVNAKVAFKQESWGIMDIYRQSVPILIFMTLLVLFYIGVAQGFNYESLVLSVLKLGGLSVSILLLLHLIDANSPIIASVCSFGSKSNCNHVLSSSAARIFGWLSWSEVGFFYFSSTSLLLFVGQTFFPLLAILNLLCLPYTVWSIYHQYKTSNWCLLCCSVQILLWAEAVLFINHGNYGFPVYQANQWMVLFLCVVMPAAIWMALKPVLISASQFEPLKNQFKKFKYDKALFGYMLQKQPKYPVNDDLMPVRLGNLEAETVITVISNPFCGPCSKAHETLDELLQYRTDLQFKLIFATTNKADDPGTQVLKHLTSLEINDKAVVSRALQDWYGQSDKIYEKWAKKYPVVFSEKANQVSERQRAWCDMVDVKLTPTILINGHKLPDPYRFEDMKYLLGK